MEDPLAIQAEQRVQQVLNPDYSIEDLLQALATFRQVSQECIFADFTSAEKRGQRLWQAHTESRKYIHRALSAFRKQGDKPVAARHLSKLFLKFVKDAQVSYREYILKLNANFGGIPELQAVAHQVKNGTVDESSQQPITPDLRAKVLNECHQTLIYLGDLSRYRASEKVDKTPDFGPALGYYGLACSLQPASGMGHHQQAVVALEQRNHLRAIYHLYCAIVVENPHPNAANNLKLEFDKTNAAWDRGELIQKGPPNDPDASKRVLQGWFVRLHSMCFKGEKFNGYEELEREVLVKLGAEVKKERLEASFMRMMKVNLAAQFYVAEKFQNQPIPENQQAFVYLFRFNIKTFTALLTSFYESIRGPAATIVVDEPEELATKLDETARRVLPGLRLYSSWLLSMVHLVSGLSSDGFLMKAVEELWDVYARTIDLIAQAFPIWDLEDLTEVGYLLEEDVDTLGFKPLVHEKTNKIWFNKQTGLVKPRFSDAGVTRVSADEEMLARIKDFLADGLYLANDDDQAPIKLRGARITYGDREIEKLIVPQTEAPAPKPVEEPSKPLTYAAAATARKQAAKAVQVPVPVAAPVAAPVVAPAPQQSRQDDLSRMVDDLVDEDYGAKPVTPPQQHLSNSMAMTNGDASYNTRHENAQDYAQVPGYGYQPQRPNSGPRAARSPAPTSPPGLRTPNQTNPSGAQDRMFSVSNLWPASPSQSTSPHFPPGLPMGTLQSPNSNAVRGHSRINSGGSNSGNPLTGDAWSSLGPGSRLPAANALASIGLSDQHHHQTYNDPSSTASPLLFGAGGGLWSRGPANPYSNVGPPNGQGG